MNLYGYHTDPESLYGWETFIKNPDTAGISIMYSLTQIGKPTTFPANNFQYMDERFREKMIRQAPHLQLYLPFIKEDDLDNILDNITEIILKKMNEDRIENPYFDEDEYQSLTKQMNIMFDRRWLVEWIMDGLAEEDTIVDYHIRFGENDSAPYSIEYLPYTIADIFRNSAGTMGGSTTENIATWVDGNINIIPEIAGDTLSIKYKVRR